jgi:hypothetical protein
MTYSALPVARMPNIQLSPDLGTGANLTNYIITFSEYAITPEWQYNFCGELYTGLTIASNRITVPKKTLAILNVRTQSYTASQGDHNAFFGIFNFTTNTMVSNMGEAKQWSINSLSGSRSQYYTTRYSCREAYAIVDAGTVLQFKVISSGNTGISTSTHVMLFQLEP